MPGLGDIGIDVKVSGKEWGDLIFDKGKFKADGAVGFGQCEEPDMLRLHGCIQKTAFIEQHELFDYGYGEKMRMYANDLLPIEQLLGWGISLPKWFTKTKPHRGGGTHFHVLASADTWGFVSGQASMDSGVSRSTRTRRMRQESESEQRVPPRAGSLQHLFDLIEKVEALDPNSSSFDKTQTISKPALTTGTKTLVPT